MRRTSRVAVLELVEPFGVKKKIIIKPEMKNRSYRRLRYSSTTLIIPACSPGYRLLRMYKARRRTRLLRLFRTPGIFEKQMSGDNNAENDFPTNYTRSRDGSAFSVLPVYSPGPVVFRMYKA